MSEQATSSSPLKIFLGSAGVFVIFGFLVLILSGFAGHESAADRAFRGDFDEATTQARIANREEISQAQAAAYDPAKVDKALSGIAKSAPKAAKTDIVVPGSPTFLKQMEEAAQAEAAKEAAKPEAAAPKKEGDAKPQGDAPQKEAAPAPKAEEKPQAEPKPAGEKKPADK